MKNGIRRELLPLVKLRGIGRVRARRLFNNSITTPDEVLTAGMDTVTRIIGRGIAEQIFSRLRNAKTISAQNTGEDTMGGQSTLSGTGDLMDSPGRPCEIRKTQCAIQDRNAFLKELREISRRYTTISSVSMPIC